jgi:hypothetical protein
MFDNLHQRHVALDDSLGQQQLATDALASVADDAVYSARSTEPSPWLMLALGVTREARCHEIGLVVGASMALWEQVVQRDLTPVGRVKITPAVLAEEPVTQVDGEPAGRLDPAAALSVEAFAVWFE